MLSQAMILEQDQHHEGQERLQDKGLRKKGIRLSLSRAEGILGDSYDRGGWKLYEDRR